MRLHAAAVLIAIPVLALPACNVAAMGPESKEHVSETRRLDRQGTFTLENTNGTVTLETWSGDTVSIEADKVGPRDLLDDVKIEIRGEGDHVDVLTRSPRVTFGRGARVEYRVKVPESARVEVETTNGAVRVLGTRASLKAETTNGSVEIGDAAGSVDASTTNGSIRVTFRDAPDAGTQRFSTTNGSVSLTLPQNARGEFEAHTVNGGISTEFPLALSGHVIGGKRLRGRLGDGGARYELSTVNGAIKILKGV
jgi:DUF4097 and DUF4098 domain-containing protein YvlB